MGESPMFAVRAVTPSPSSKGNIVLISLVSAGVALLLFGLGMYLVCLRVKKHVIALVAQDATTQTSIFSTISMMASRSPSGNSYSSTSNHNNHNNNNNNFNSSGSGGSGSGSGSGNINPWAEASMQRRISSFAASVFASTTAKLDLSIMDSNNKNDETADDSKGANNNQERSNDDNDDDGEDDNGRRVTTAPPHALVRFIDPFVERNDDALFDTNVARVEVAEHADGMDDDEQNNVGNRRSAALPPLIVVHPSVGDHHRQNNNINNNNNNNDNNNNNNAAGLPRLSPSGRTVPSPLNRQFTQDRIVLRQTQAGTDGDTKMAAIDEFLALNSLRNQNVLAAAATATTAPIL